MLATSLLDIARLSSVAGLKMEIPGHPNNYPQIKMEEMEIKVEELHHSIDIKDDPSLLESPLDRQCKQKTIMEQNANSKPRTGEKPFMCEFCGYKTTHVSILYIYIYITFIQF